VRRWELLSGNNNQPGIPNDFFRATDVVEDAVFDDESTRLESRSEAPLKA
jgi:hypothetical protein